VQKERRGADLQADMNPSDGREIMESVRPIVTVVIATYNAAGTLRKALDSVLNQPCSRIELVVIDGGSTDGTVDVIREYGDRIASWVSEPDRGVYDAMNKGVLHGTGRWYYFLGADDTLAEGFCRAVERLENPSTIYYGDVWMPERGLRYDGEFTSLKLALRNICHQSIFYPRRVWELHSYDVRYPVFADYALNLACFGEHELRFEYLPVIVAVFQDKKGLSQVLLDSAFEADKLQLVKTGFSRQVYLIALVWHWGLHALKRIGLYHGAWLLKNAIKRRLQCLCVSL
jgi:glycosyltransferase involved in cell wall biosynthesis